MRSAIKRLSITLSIAAGLGLAGQSAAQTASSGYELTSLATGLDAPVSITVDDTYIYTGSNATGNVTRLNHDGSGATTLITGPTQVWGMDTDATTLYIADNVNDDIFSTPKDGSGGLTTLVSGLTNTLSVVLDGADLYMGEFANNAIYTAPAAGGAFSTVKNVTGRVPGIAVDGSYVYFSQPDQGKVQRTLKDGTGPIEDIVTSGINFSWGLELIGNDLYIADSGAGKIFKIAKDGSGSLVEIASGFTDARNISAEGGDLYISDDGTDTIFRLSPAAIAGAGYSASTVAFGLTGPMGLAVDANYLYSGSISTGEVTRMGKDGSSPSVIVTGGAQFWGMDVDATSIYIADNHQDDVWSAPIGGGALTSLVSNLSNNTEVVVDGSTLFIGDFSTNAAYTAPTSGGGTATVLVNLSNSATGIAFDDTYLYMGLGSDGKVVRVLKDGSGTVDEIATGLNYVWDVTLVGSDLYIADQGAGKVFRMAKSGGALTEIASNFDDVRTLANDGTDVFATDAGRETIVKLVREPVTVSIPDVTSPYDELISIPVQVTDTSGQGIVSFEAFIDYDGDLLTPISADLTGTLAASGWSIHTNIEEGGVIDTYKIAMATDDDELVGAGDLVNVTFQVDSARIPATSALTLAHVLFNDGVPGYIAIDGSLTVVGATGTITSLPGTIIPRETITITVVDADEDLDGTAGTDQVSVAVENTTTSDIVNLTLNEDGAIAGTFSATVGTEFGTAAIVDALIQAQAGEAIVATYSDALDAAGTGPNDRTATTNVIGGADGTAAATLVSQPGDPIYIRVSDSDLNTSVSTAESASVTVTNSRTAEVFTVVLTEVDVDDDVFFGSLATVPGASTATEMNTAEEDVLTVTYDDVVTANGNQLDRTADDDVVDPWGDADDNESLQAFDAAQVLFDVLSGGTYLAPLGRRSANVDNASVTTGINVFDASLILQKRVGLIATFPVQDPAAENHPQNTPASPKLIPETRSLSLVAQDGYISVRADRRDGLVAGDLTVSGVSGRVEMGSDLASHLSAVRETEEGLRIVFAGAEAAAGSGELLRIHGVGPANAQLVRAAFNNGEITGTATASVTAAPAAFALHANAPNPFNPSTTIRFDLAHATGVELTVFDVLGQKVRRLVADQLPAGAHSAVWDGRNEAGAQVGNGVYLYQLRTADFISMKRMLLLK